LIDASPLNFENVMGFTHFGLQGGQH